MTVSDRQTKQREYRAKYRERHKERRNAEARAYYAENRERLRARERARYAAMTGEQRAAHNRRYNEWERARGADYRKDKQLRLRYGINLKEWLALLAAQNERCACCGADKAGERKTWATDHCHETGRIRGILCNYCNLQIGNLGDSSERIRARLEQILRYLDRSK